jgi:hypothetical protein
MRERERERRGQGKGVKPTPTIKWEDERKTVIARGLEIEVDMQNRKLFRRLPGVDVFNLTIKNIVEDAFRCAFHRHYRCGGGKSSVTAAVEVHVWWIHHFSHRCGCLGVGARKSDMD